MAQSGKISLTQFQLNEILAWYDENYSIADGDDCAVWLSPFFITTSYEGRPATYLISVDGDLRTGRIAMFPKTYAMDINYAKFVCDFKVINDKRAKMGYGIDTDFKYAYQGNIDMLDAISKNKFTMDSIGAIINEIYVSYRGIIKLLEVSNGKTLLPKETPKWLAKKEKKARKNRGKPTPVFDTSNFIFYGDRKACAILPDTVRPIDVLGYDMPIIEGDGKTGVYDDADMEEQNEEASKASEDLDAVLDRFIVLNQMVIQALHKKSRSMTKTYKKVPRRSFTPGRFPLSSMEIVRPDMEVDDKVGLIFRIFVKEGGNIVIYIGTDGPDLDNLEAPVKNYVPVPAIGTIRLSNGIIDWKLSPYMPPEFRNNKKVFSILDDFYAEFCGINKLIGEEQTTQTQSRQGSKEKIIEIDKYAEQIVREVSGTPKIRTIFLNSDNHLTFDTSSGSRGGYQHTHEYTRRGCWVHMKNGKVYWRRESVCCKGRGPRVQKTTIIKES